VTAPSAEEAAEARAALEELYRLEYFLANAAERASAAKRDGGCQWVFLDDDSAENDYQLAAVQEGVDSDYRFGRHLRFLRRFLVRFRRQVRSRNPWSSHKYLSISGR